MDIKTTTEALATLSRLHDQDWFPAPRNCTVAYAENGGLLISTSQWELYNVGPEGDVVRFYLRVGSMESVYLD